MLSIRFSENCEAAYEYCFVGHPVVDPIYLHGRRHVAKCIQLYEIAMFMYNRHVVTSRRRPGGGGDLITKNYYGAIKAERIGDSGAGTIGNRGHVPPPQISQSGAGHGGKQETDRNILRITKALTRTT